MPTEKTKGKGGKREGAGRPKAGNESRVISIRVTQDQADHIAKLARNSNLSKPQWVLREVHRALQTTRPR